MVNSEIQPPLGPGPAVTQQILLLPPPLPAFPRHHHPSQPSPSTDELKGLLFSHMADGLLIFQEKHLTGVPLSFLGLSGCPNDKMRKWP